MDRISPDQDAQPPGDHEPEDDPDQDLQPDELNPAYIAHLSEHVSQSQTHFSGQDLAIGPLPPSLFAPNAHWTSAEKDLFFHGLSIYSRFRPDLIAEHIKTKNVADVCMYIDMLEEAAAADGQADDGGHAPVQRKQLPVAYEVSDKWTLFEERQAQALVSSQTEQANKDTADTHTQEIREYRNAIRAPKGLARTTKNERDREGERARKKQTNEWLERKQRQWDLEDVLSAMDGETLRAIDAVMREEEEALLVSSQPGLESHQSELVETERNAQAELAEDTVDETMDPTLRGMSSSAPPTSTAVASPHPETQPTASSRPSTPSYPRTQHTYGQFNPMTPPFPLDQQLDPLPQRNNPPLPSTPSTFRASGHDDVSPSQNPDDALSPASRKRLKKRLHMRRKRAEAAGKVAEESLERLKPGRKPKKRPPENNSDGEEVGGRNRDDEDETEPSGEYRHKHMSGPTRRYKIQGILARAGFDTERLRGEGMGLFHLGGFAKLMKTYNALHDVDQDVSSQISANTLKFFEAHIVEFTKSVVRRAIVSREQEKIAKTHTKVWRLAEHQVITTANVEHALSLCGADHLNKKAHFQGLLGRLGLTKASFSSTQSEDVSRASTPAEDEDGLDAEPEEEEEEDEEDPEGQSVENEQSSLKHATSSLSLHRTVFPPFVRLPSSFSQPQSLDPPPISSYLPWSTTAALDAQDYVEEDEDEIMTDETDEEAFEEEMLEEEALNKIDETMEESYEQGLWAKFSRADGGGAEAHTKSQPKRQPRRKRKRSGGEDEGGDDEDETQMRGKHHSLRFRRPSPSGRIKSKVYVDDSD